MEDKYTDTETKKRSSGRRKPKKERVSFSKKLRLVLINLLGMAALVVGVTYMTLKWLDRYTNHGEYQTVPQVTDMQLDDAAAMLQRNKLNYVVVEREYKPYASENDVIKQYPKPGSYVKEGRKVELVVNTVVKPKRSIPAVIDNRTYREAESHIKAAGFVIEKIDTIPGEKDWVYELRYKGKSLINGETIPLGSKITVVIGNGKVQVKDQGPVFDESFGI